MKVQVSNGEETILSRTLPYVRPGEMVTIPIKEKYKEQIKEANHLFVQVINDGEEI